jgi:acetyl esterase/lipase
VLVKPKISELLDKIKQLKPYLDSIGYKMNQTNVREALALMTFTYMTDYNKMLFSLDDVVMNGQYPVPVRIYHPQPGTALPVAVFVHGGGHMAGGISVYDGIARKLSESIKHIVVSVEYRLTPEFAYPTGIEDTMAAVRGVFNVLDERKMAYINHDLTLIGDSAGAAICASIAMNEAFVKDQKIKKQVLIYPSVDYTLTSPSLETLGVGYLLEKSKIEWYFKSYFQNNENRQAASPVYGHFYKGMPQTLVVVASHDPLIAEGTTYYKNVLNAGVHAELLQIDGVVHAFLMLENLCPEECAKTYQEMNKFLLASS